MSEGTTTDELLCALYWVCIERPEGWSRARKQPKEFIWGYLNGAGYLRGVPSEQVVEELLKRLEDERKRRKRVAAGGEGVRS